jgi:DNA-binding MarR family transcriptional regulator
MARPISADDIAMSALLRAARAAYTDAVRKALADAGFDDMPRNGAYVIGAIGNGGATMANIIRGLGVTKQAAGQLIDTLVLRGYVERRADEDDRRKLTVALTTGGEEAAAIIRKAANAVDAKLKKRVGEKSVAEARKVLFSLILIANEGQSS